MRNFWRNLFYAMAVGAFIGLLIRQRRERREALARAAMRAPPVIGPPPLPPLSRPPVIDQGRARPRGGSRRHWRRP